MTGSPNRKAPGPGCPQEALAVAMGQCTWEALPLSRFSAQHEALERLGSPSEPIYGLARQLRAEAPSGCQVPWVWPPCL